MKYKFGEVSFYLITLIYILMIQMKLSKRKNLIKQRNCKKQS